jgi:hypothetical protein
MPMVLDTPEKVRAQVPINVKWGLQHRHVLNVLTTNVNGNRVLMKVEPHYMNIDWDNRPYFIGKCLTGFAPPSSKDGWVIFFIENIVKCNIM